ncbi:TetR family transcriptional regulator [Bogoriella caseilytica]|uniref:TetR family transcriptional regulator n=2 Tax=Bogoriella caseilytica TaxID=56055 RepID=A0A3N2BAQ6_9MICO|nr:TetR family transcriptional regulator [Bogoriella caseilytica]
MRHVQSVALGLFLERGFEAVTVEEVAERSEVSASTVYRYFGTKEGLVLHDEFDDQVLTGLTHFLHQGLTPWQAFEGALELVGEAHFVVEEEATLARIRLCLQNPSVRAAAHLMLEEMVDGLAEITAKAGHLTFPQARVLLGGIGGALFAALKNWHDAGGEGGWRRHVSEAVETVKSSVPG